MQSVLILGATSSIARACSEIFASRHCTLFLASRDVEELKRIASDLELRFNSNVHYSFFDITQLDSHASFFENVIHKMGFIDGVLMAVGLIDQLDYQKVINANFTGPITFLELFADYLNSKEDGFIIGLSSVAGDRGRKPNYTYGASKAGLTAYLQGLRNRLHLSKIKVLTVKLGLIDTKMVFGGKYPLRLAANPKKTAVKIINALDKNKESVYIPTVWRFIMFFIQCIPEKIFKRFNL
ncbi:SDR family NAD(P)-dependent oxidoreductase [Rickettsiella grylli]|uniref:Short-chain dehydrogenase/reductase SDR n=1 Tax=Rickettsiella grylli TaxID=59196 RepID=A8PQG3_9COXI|nr:SDR family NAD(P)-dependent oxidoreductase [Rickettsiella grylli]EDP47009.1 short-chain dehydrogenase/reductase SDR [Rickettsiella grylli]